MTHTQGLAKRHLGASLALFDALSRAGGGHPLAARVREFVDAPERLLPARFRPVLTRGPLTHAAPHDPALPASAALRRPVGDAVPAISLVEPGRPEHVWRARRDLLGSGPDTLAFTVEIEADQSAALRFGDNVHARRPRPGVPLAARYRVGVWRRDASGAQTESLRRDGILTAIAANRQSFTDQREVARLGLDLVRADGLVVDVESQRAVGRHVGPLLDERGRQNVLAGGDLLGRFDLLLEHAAGVVDVLQHAVAHIERDEQFNGEQERRQRGPTGMETYRRDERGLVRTQPVVVRRTGLLPGVGFTAAFARLHGLDRRGEGEFSETVAHGLLLRVQRLCRLGSRRRAVDIAKVAAPVLVSMR